MENYILDFIQPILSFTLDCSMVLCRCTVFRRIGRPIVQYGRWLSLERFQNLDVLNDLVERRGMYYLEGRISRFTWLRKAVNIVMHSIRTDRQTCNNISKEIGKLMQNGDMGTIPALKAQLEQSEAKVLQAEEERRVLKAEMDSLLYAFPNLLDDRYVRMIN